VLQLGLGITVFLALWQATALLAGLPAALLPTPLTVMHTAVIHAATIYPHVVYTGYEIAAGWTIGVSIGVVFAAAMVVARPVRATLYPVLLTIRIVPLIVVAPLLLMAFGTTFETRVLITVLLMFFPVTVTTLEGLRATPVHHLMLVESVGASRWQKVIYIRLPNAIPQFLAGLKIASPVAVQGVILAEFLAAERGVGHQLLETAQQFQTALLFTYIGVLVVFSGILYGVVVWVERSIPWASDRSAGTLTTPASTSTRRAVTNALGIIVTLIVVTWLWGVGATTTAHATLFLPSPERVATTLMTLSDLYLTAGLQSLTLFTVGWLSGAVLGGTLGVAAGMSQRVRQPLLVGLVGVRATPDIAVVPLLLVWLHVSFKTGVVLVVLSTFYPVTIGVAAGLRAMPASHGDLLTLVDASPWETLSVRVRFALPSLFAGVKLSVIAGLTGTVIAEWFIADQGLGVLVLQGMTNYQPEVTYAAAVCLALLGLGLFGIVAVVHRTVTW
jgi:NitT/TauT family transport system permease protein